MTAEYEIKDEVASDIEQGVIQTLEITVARDPADSSPAQSPAYYTVRFDRVEGGGQLMWMHTKPHSLQERVQSDSLNAALEAAEYIEDHYDETVDTGLIQR